MWANACLSRSSLSIATEPKPPDDLANPAPVLDYGAPMSGQGERLPKTGQAWRPSMDVAEDGDPQFAFCSPSRPAHVTGMENIPRQQVSRLVTRLGIRDAAALRRIHPALAARVAADGDAQLDTGVLMRIAVLR